jgi:HNH endonuclease
MKRGGPLKRKTRLKAHSERGLSYEEELKAITPMVLARARHQCEVQLDGCRWHPQPTPHHRKRRSQGGPNTLRNLLAVCSYCHGWIHQHPAESYDRGLLIRHNDPITPFLGVSR